MHRALLFAALSAGVCGLAGCPSRTQTRKEEPTGLVAAKPVAPTGKVASPEWDLRFDADPAIASISAGDDELLIETVQRGNLEAGVYAFSVERAPVQAARGSEALAVAAAEDWHRQDGAQTGPPEPVTFLGLPAHAFVLASDEATGLEVHAVVGACVYRLLVLRAASQALTNDVASDVLKKLRTMSGGPADPPRCR